MRHVCAPDGNAGRSLGPAHSIAIRINNARMHIVCMEHWSPPEKTAFLCTLSAWKKNIGRRVCAGGHWRDMS